MHTPSQLICGRAGWETEKTCMLCKHCSATAKISAISTVFITNQNHSTIWVAMKKDNCITVRPCTNKENLLLFCCYMKKTKQNCSGTLFYKYLNRQTANMFWDCGWWNVCENDTFLWSQLTCRSDFLLVYLAWYRIRLEFRIWMSFISIGIGTQRKYYISHSV